MIERLEKLITNWDHRDHMAENTHAEDEMLSGLKRHKFETHPDKNILLKSDTTLAIASLS